MTVKQAAERAEVSVGLIYCWIESRLLPHYRLGASGRRGKIVIAEADLLAFLDTMKVEVRPAPTPMVKAKPIKLRHLELP
jgi:excisionase family DNA binding protein